MSKSEEAQKSLHTFFSPRSIAVIGASLSKGKLGHAVLSNMRQSDFSGTSYPVNPSSNEILGLPCYPDLNALSGEIDLAVNVIPDHMVS